jgi:hypothetical protein
MNYVLIQNILLYFWLFGRFIHVNTLFVKRGQNHMTQQNRTTQQNHMTHMQVAAFLKVDTKHN